jgi:nucleotide-binding universal stress UspA family protein
MLPAHTIVFPTDFSEHAARVFPVACTLARDEGARLIVLHVMPPPLNHAEVVARRPPDGYRDELWRMLHRIQAPEANVRVEHRLEEGDAATEILRVAGDTGVGLIVMGTHGRTGLKRLLMGSVAEQVLRRAACPVLTVKAPPPAGKGDA